MLTPGWQTTRGNKDYMMSQVQKNLKQMVCHDAEFIRQCRNHRKLAGDLVIVGFTDVFMATAIGICCMSPNQPKRGYGGKSGWNWK